jgi:hypothetical protein
MCALVQGVADGQLTDQAAKPSMKVRLASRGATNTSHDKRTKKLQAAAAQHVRGAR